MKRKTVEKIHERKTEIPHMLFKGRNLFLKGILTHWYSNSPLLVP